MQIKGSDNYIMNIHLMYIWHAIISATGEQVDYSFGSNTIMFPAGMTRVVFNVSIMNDNLLEGNETFVLIISSSSIPSGVNITDPAQAVVTIVDDEGK